MELVLDLSVDIVGEVVLNQLDALEEGTAERKHIGLRGRDVEVGLGAVSYTHLTLPTILLV